MKLALVIQRFGPGVIGGAEYQCLQVAKRLQTLGHDVHILTTCARDYITWENAFSPGLDNFQGLPVRRFAVKKQRNPRRFADLSKRVFYHDHTREQEEQWVTACGPYAPGLVRYIKTHEPDYDRFIFYCFRYYTSYHGALAVPHKAVIVPTAEADRVITLAIYRDFFNQVAGIVYNTPEEKELVQTCCQCHKLPSICPAMGLDVPGSLDPERFRSATGIKGPYILYVGRLDRNKGIPLLLHGFFTYKLALTSDLQLVLAGKQVEEVPDHKAIRYVGFLEEEMKYHAMAGCRFFVNASRLESLSIVILEAWATGRPVLVNGRCDVLKGQVRRARGGLFFSNARDFVYAGRLLEKSPGLRERMGASGRQYVRETYDWQKVMTGYERLLRGETQID